MRAKTINNTMAQSLTRFGEIAMFTGSEEDKERFSEWTMLSLMKAIAELLHQLGAEEPIDPAAAVLFYLSLDPMHRRAARYHWEHATEFFASDVEEWWPTLAVFYKMVCLTWPGQGEVWREGITDMPDVFRDPTQGQTETT